MKYNSSHFYNILRHNSNKSHFKADTAENKKRILYYYLFSMKCSLLMYCCMNSLVNKYCCYLLIQVEILMMIMKLFFEDYLQSTLHPSVNKKSLNLILSIDISILSCQCNQEQYTFDSDP